ncbi:energy transducer TonB [Sulfitobacter sabulilitoris]|uniref:Energy transducer TonB n=1 Tax=Sulfitobacter sabulilitoris TaxID=2562655 RepID=A0A5S3PLH5_9RHOB|nr:energy transducer TonB [Sulfitobacter sabulilitoris]TMM55249.1 energy transducer TonB [Sulfitobacter sabulilitoris]
MHAGHYISGVGHLALIGWLLLGDVFAAEPLPIDMTPVSVISQAEYEAMMAAQTGPQSVTEVAQPAAPQEAPQAPDVSPATDQATAQTAPAQSPTPPAEVPPQAAEPAPPQPPRADVSDTAPVLPEPPSEVAVLVPDVSDRPVPRASERVAPEPVAQPEPEATPDEVAQEAIAPSTEGEAVEEPREATAPEAAATEIVTEAEKPAAAPRQSSRPPSRRPDPLPETARVEDTTPAQPTAAAPEPAAAPAAQADKSAINDALAEALGAATPSAPAPAAPQGPPLTSGEREALRVAVSSCWNVGSLSSEALRTIVVVSVGMQPDGKPINASIRLASSSGGSEGAARQAFEAARRAIILCGSKGFDLPQEKFGQWQDIEITFNPERMRNK